MIKAIEATKKEFQSSSERTPEYRSWHRLFKREFTRFLVERGIKEIHFSKPNHFDLSGFFGVDKTNQVYYFNISDLRWSKNTMLLRKAKNFKDYTGERNNDISLESVEKFTKEFDYTINNEAS